MKIEASNAHLHLERLKVQMQKLNDQNVKNAQTIQMLEAEIVRLNAANLQHKERTMEQKARLEELENHLSVAHLLKDRAFNEQSALRMHKLELEVRFTGSVFL
jgi:hypothetical protein